MRDRWYRKGGKGYDPQVGEAAKANTAVAERSQQWNEDFFDKYVAPTLTQAMRESEVNLGRQGQIFDLQMDQAKLADQRYRTLGMPAEDRYYAMVDKYTRPEELAAREEEQASGAIGDIRTAQSGQQAAQDRQLRSLGVDPTSPMAVAAKNQNAIQQAAMEASAATQARRGAQALGMQLTSDAANYGKGALSAVQGFAQGAGGASSAALSGAQGTAQLAPGGAANVNTGLGIAQKSYGANLDAYTDLQKTKMQQPSALSSIGNMVGTMGASYLSGGLAGSDRRMKKATKKIVTLAHDIGLWAFRYIWEPDTAPLHYGYMADEVEPIFPDAVAVGPGGFKLIDYSKVPV
jgi:hypothetical protein